MQTMLELETRGPALHEITREVAGVVAGRGDGLVTLLIQHTSASLLIQENADPDVRRDLMGFFGRLVPRGDDPSMRWLNHTLEGPDDMPAHIKAALLPVSLQVPVCAGRLVLGTWQGIYVVEHRDRPHRRRVALHFAPDRPEG